MSPPASERAEPIASHVHATHTLRPSYGARTAQRAVPTTALNTYVSPRLVSSIASYRDKLWTAHSPLELVGSSAPARTGKGNSAHNPIDRLRELQLNCAQSMKCCANA